MNDPRGMYAAFLLVAALVSATVTIAALRRASKVAARAVAILMAALTVWSLTYALFWLGVPAPSRFFWLDATYIGVVTVPTAFLVLVIVYTHREQWLSRRNLVLLSVEPVLTVTLFWTNRWHGLFFGGTRRGDEGVILRGGFWFWVNAVYSYGLVLLALILLIYAFRQERSLYRKQMGTILLGALLPWIVNIVTLAGFSPFPNLDLTPLVFTITGLVFSYGIYRFHFLDILPVARDRLVDVMDEGVLVIDESNRIVYLNTSAQRLLGRDGYSLIGRNAEEALAIWPALVRCSNSAETLSIVTEQGQERHVEVRSVVLQSGSSVGGHLMILHDVTDRTVATRALQEAHDRLRKQLAEINELQAQLREEAIRDSLTGLFNRRYLQETLTREIARCTREDRPLALAILDLDGFKQINDEYGHSTGDVVLTAVARIVAASTRKSDVACRYGGDEFVVVLPGAALPDACRRMEGLRREIEVLSIPHEGVQLHTTISVGVSAFPMHGNTQDGILRAADNALYAAKSAGGNRVICAGQPPQSGPRLSPG